MSPYDDFKGRIQAALDTGNIGAIEALFVDTSKPKAPVAQTNDTGDDSGGTRPPPPPPGE